ncbi:MAG: threonine synthase, partial [Spirochaetaceae bacterium]|nr:threonine synthase [Spirochaetaceae bacterium]
MKYVNSMQFKSTRSDNVPVSFKDAVLHCLPQNGGLYVPTSVPDMRQFFLHMDADTSYLELVSAVAPVLLHGELNPFSALRVAESAFDFEPELVTLNEHISILNLSGGHTGTFKDFGIAFLAAVMEELLKTSGRVIALSATRGETGMSIARAFQSRRNIINIILYPQGPIYGLDPKDFVPNGGTLIPIQVKGTFDDCQRLVFETLHDRSFAERHLLTSANTINVGRLLPQSFYYLYAFTKIKKQLRGDLVFSIPCGNCGNLIAGLYAWRFGLPVNSFIAAMNKNNTFRDFINGENFSPRTPIPTFAPALDVTIPSNYERLEAFYTEAPAVMRNMVFPITIDDPTTLATIAEVWDKHGLMLDPHTALAFAAALNFAHTHDSAHIIVLSTGHPARTAAIVQKAIGIEPELPVDLAWLHSQTKPLASI